MSDYKAEELKEKGNVQTLGMDVAQKREMLEKLVLVREFELACERWWKAGIPLLGEFHLSLGQEAFSVGTCMATEFGDPICPSIRGMGVYLCRGVPLESLIASFLDREGGISDGRWPHWHSPVPEYNILPQTGMLGSGLVTAVGVAMAKKLAESRQVVVGMLGDGATNTGYFHEGINLAAVQRAPIVIIIENNQYAVSTPIRDTALVSNLSDRATGYGLPGSSVDGTDAVAVYSVIRDAVRRARDGQGPSLVELKGYRWGGQTLKDPDKTRPSDEKSAAQQHCPVTRLRNSMVLKGELPDEEYVRIVAGAKEMIEKAKSYAEKLAAIAPPLQATLTHVLNPYCD